MNEITNQKNWIQYQNTLELIFLACLKKQYPSVLIQIVGCFNKALYFTTSEPIDCENLKQQMKQVIDQNLTIEEINGNYQLLGFATDFSIGCFQNTSSVPLFDLTPYQDGVLLHFPHYRSADTIIMEDQKQLAQIFLQSKQLANQLHCATVTQLNQHCTQANLTNLILQQEQLHKQQLQQLAQAIQKSQKRVVLICGPSSSGKTSFAKRLCQQLHQFGLKTLYMGTDDYYVEKNQMPKGEDGQNDYECLEALDVDLFQKNIKGLIAGEIVDAPIFDFDQMTKIFGQNFKQIDRDTILVIEGILTLDQRLTSSIPNEDKFKIYISPISTTTIDDYQRLSNCDIRLMRRICRDYRARNTKVERTLELWQKVRDGEEKNIFPYINQADAIFNTYCIYEPLIINPYITPLLQQVTKDSPYYWKAQHLLERTQRFQWADSQQEAQIINNSIIREFIGGSILVD